MEQPHTLGVYTPAQTVLENVASKFLIEGLLHAQKKTVVVLHEIRAHLKVGMTENDARLLALEIFKQHGVTKHWHRPYIRFGAGTTLTFNHPIQADYRLQENDPYYLDLGPVWPAEDDTGLEYEGDYGDTFVFGTSGGTNAEAEKCAELSRKLFQEVQALWRREKLSGEALYLYLEKRAAELGYKLADDVLGHRLGDFPHQKYSKERLAKLKFTPKDSLWVLEVQLVDPQNRFGAFFEDLL